MMQKKPLVSVIIPAYRCADTIDTAIQSVLIQDIHLEMIVVNDMSPDSLDTVMEKYKGDPRFVYVKNQKNMGAAKSRNKAVLLAKAPYVAFLDADDCWRAGKLKKQLEVMRKTQAVLCATSRELMTVDGKETGRVLRVKELVTYEELLKHNSIACSSVLLRRDVAIEFPMKHEDSHEDYITWMRILRKYNYACGIDEPFVLYRVSNQGKSGGKLKSARMTFKAYRYMGFGLCKSLTCFMSYAWNGIKKYYLTK